MHRVIFFALLTANLMSCQQSSTPTGIRLVGLDPNSCQDGTLLFGSVPLLAVPEGPGNFSSVTFLIEGQEPIIDLDSPFETLFDAQNDGPVKIAATGIDSEGETQSTSVEVCIDNSGPRFTIKQPPQRISVEDDELAIQVEQAQDDHTVQRISAILDIAGTHQEVECAPMDRPICLLRPRLMNVALDPGQIVTGKLTVTARDSAGHEKTETQALEVNTHLLWKKYIGGNLAWEPLIINEKLLAIGTSYSFIQLMDLSGKALCTYSVPNTSTIQPGTTIANMNRIVTPLVSNADGSRLFFATMKAMWALTIAADGSTCALLWRRELVLPAGDPKDTNQEYYEETTFAYNKDQGVLFISLYDGEASPVLLHALSSDTGALLGDIPIGSEKGGEEGIPIALSPTLSIDGNTLFIGRRGLYAIKVDPLFSPSPGTMVNLASFFKPSTNFTAPPLHINSLLYVPAWDGNIYALNAADLSPAPVFNFEPVSGYFKSKVVSSADGQTLFTANEENSHLYAFDPITGASKGKINIGKAHTAFPVPGPDGTIYITTQFPEEKNQLNAIAFPEMKLRWVFAPTGRDTFQASPVINGNILYVGNGNGFLYALEVGANGS